MVQIINLFLYVPFFLISVASIMHHEDKEKETGEKHILNRFTVVLDRRAAEAAVIRANLATRHPPARHVEGKVRRRR